MNDIRVILISEGDFCGSNYRGYLVRELTKAGIPVDSSGAARDGTLTKIRMADRDYEQFVWLPPQLTKEPPCKTT
jgi:hypothetical protein